MSIGKNNGNGNKRLTGMGMEMEMGLKLIAMGRIGKAESHPRNLCMPFTYPQPIAAILRPRGMPLSIRYYATLSRHCWELGYSAPLPMIKLSMNHRQCYIT